jgi:hypothetical protein
VHSPTGARAVRFLSRGKWRNAAAPPEAHVQAAVDGSRGAMPLAPAAQAAYDRVFGASGDKFGYADSFGGQGYSGGIYGKAERTGPGNTGVAAAADLGVRDPLSHTFVAPPRHFSSDDFRAGAALELASPGSSTVGLTNLYIDDTIRVSKNDFDVIFVFERGEGEPIGP